MADCGVCAYASEHGSWPLDHRGTHCADTMEYAGLNPGCHRSWNSAAQSHCTVCHRHFGSDSAGDAHRRSGECIEPKGVGRWETPEGITYGGRDPQLSAVVMERVRNARMEPRGQGQEAA